MLVSSSINCVDESTGQVGLVSDVPLLARDEYSHAVVQLMERGKRIQLLVTFMSNDEEVETICYDDVMREVVESLPSGVILRDKRHDSHEVLCQYIGRIGYPGLVSGEAVRRQV